LGPAAFLDVRLKPSSDDADAAVCAA